MLWTFFFSCRLKVLCFGIVLSQLHSMTLYGQVLDLSLRCHPEQWGGKSDNVYDLFHTYYTCSLRKEFVEACRCYNSLLKFNHNEYTWKYLFEVLLCWGWRKHRLLVMILVFVHSGYFISCLLVAVSSLAVILLISLWQLLWSSWNWEDLTSPIK